MARFNKGWVKAWRDMVDGDLPQNIWLWGIWNWLLYSATWKPTKIIWKGKQREIPAGSVVMGLVELSNKWGCSINTIKRWLKYLEESERIMLEMCTRGTLVTLRNWDVYQSQELSECTPSENEVKTECKPSENELQLSKEVKKERIKKERKIHVGIRTEYPQEFDQLWNLYSRRCDKKAAFEEYKKLNLGDTERQDLEKAIRNYVQEIPDGSYRKHFHRFLKSDWREFVKADQPGSDYDLSRFT